jgi:HAE1 family hydrophobic/amphiphilic exporter-1
LSKLANLSLANRIVVALLTILVAVGGFVSLSSLKQELIPSIQFPTAAVVTPYPGASPEIVDEQVSQVLESSITSLEGIESTSATSSQGLSVITATFQFGKTTNEITDALSSAVNSIDGSLPSDVTPQVIAGSFDEVPIIVLAISADDGDNETIAEQLEEIAPSLFRQVDGVRDVAISGAREKRIQMDIDQQALAGFGLSQQSITTALEQNGLVLPAGTLEDEAGSIAVEVGSRVESVEDFAQLPLLSPGQQTAVLISDVADVELIDAPISSISRVNGAESLSIAITKTPDGNSVDVSNGVTELITELEEGLSKPVTITTTLDQAPFIEKSIEDLATEGLLGLSFAVLVILVFLLSVKSTIITAVSIPSSVLITFIGLAVADFSLNILTLGGLTIAIGRVVDDSIVVIENINRHLSYGKQKLEAIKTAVKEVAGAITSSTITNAAVFVPIGLVGGIVGELFRPFAFTVALALLASLLVSLTIIPVLAYWFLGMSKKLKKAQAENPEGFEQRQRDQQEAEEQKGFLQKGYVPILKTTTDHPWITLTAALLVLGYTFSLVPQLRTDFLDDGGSDQFVINQELSGQSSFEEQDAASKELEKLVQGVDGVDIVQASVGSTVDSRVAFGASAEGIRLTVTIEEDADIEQVRQDVTREAGARDDLGDVSISEGGGGFGGSDTIDIEIASASDADLQRVVDDVVQAMRPLSYVDNVTTSLAAAERVLEVQVDREAAAQVGLSEIAVSGIVSNQLRPQPIGLLNIEGQEVDIYVENQQIPETIEEVERIQIPTATGPVSLDSIALVEEVLKPRTITSALGDRTATVSIASNFDDLGAVTEQITEALDKVELPAGTDAIVGGLAADQAESFQQLGLALLAAIAIIYIVLVATFGSLIQPLILLISIPFAATGAFVMLLITDIALAVPSLIGLLLLTGIVVTNAIVLIDLINQYREQGRTVQDAMFSGSRQRLRPILMTAFATIFALTPLALGATGGSGFISQPLAVVVIGGLFSSTILTLILVPVLYWLIEGRADRKQIRIQRREQNKLERATRRARRARA